MKLFEPGGRRASAHAARSRGLLVAFAAVVAFVPAAAKVPADALAHPELWPVPANQVAKDPDLETRVNEILSAMSLEDQVGQLIQVDIANIKPEDLLTYKLGSVLNGGTSGPYGNDKAPAADWLRLADEFYRATMTRTDGRPRIPLIWGTDAVHGNNNVPGATLFPHNIGLGAARDPDLVRKIGWATAIETSSAGQEWTFAPTVAVAQDDRWGRTYESYSEDPSVVREMAAAMVEGLQGRAGTAQFLEPGRVVSSTKHFLADGGTPGRDQGNATISEAELIAVHLPGYEGALAAGTQIIMASFSSWNGVKMTANKSILTDVLKGRMGFDGFVVSDWNAHGQLPACTTESCPSAINAGLDMFMYSGNNWRALYDNTLAQTQSGEIPAERLDDAVRRILRVKLRAGLFEAGPPSSRPFAGKFETLGAPAHRALAREAVRKSLVLLKNDGVLPLKPTSRILVAGTAADSISQAAGGWSITWQGTDVANADFPNGQSIWKGIEQAVAAAGGQATYSADGSFSEKPDAAIVVFGEKPYAEMLGDRPDLEFSPQDKSHLELLRKLKTADIPVVAVFLSGRPMWVNSELNASNAFVAAFLPGTEGGGVADVLLRAKEGSIAHDFAGKLSFSWPKRPDQYSLNRGQPDYEPLLPYGYGLTYASPGTVPVLDEKRPLGVAIGEVPIYGGGTLPEGWSLSLHGSAQAPPTFVAGSSGTLFGLLTVKGVDRRTQEDSRGFAWAGQVPAEVRIDASGALDLTAQEQRDQSLIVEYRVDEAPTGEVRLGMISANTTRVTLPITGAVKRQAAGQWAELAVPLRCFVAAGLDPARVTTPFVLAADGRLRLTMSDVRLGLDAGHAPCPE